MILLPAKPLKTKTLLIGLLPSSREFWQAEDLKRFTPCRASIGSGPRCGLEKIDTVAITKFMMIRSFTLSVLFVLNLTWLEAQSRPANDLVVAGNVRPEVATSIDLGEVAGATQLNGLVLELQIPEDTLSALKNTIEALHNPQSPTFHHWLTTMQFTQQLAVPPDRIFAAQSWLQSQGFTLDGLSTNRSAVYFSGTVAQVESAFHTHMHHFKDANGRTRTANLTTPMIPASLAFAVKGLVALNDFGLHHAGFKQAGPQLVGGDGGGANQNLGARDLAVVYGIDQVQAAGYSGQGQTIAVLEPSDVYSIGDWLAYRRVSGLTKAFPQGQLVPLHPAGDYPCTDPGAVPEDEEEATLDAEVATAAAPNATVAVAACQGTVGNDGILAALGNLLTSSTRPQVVSISYGEPEALLSSSERQEIELLYMQAAGLGISVFVSGGDDGADANHADRNIAGTHGISTNGRATTPWNVAVGGTDFEDTYFGTVSEYWSSTNSATGESALSYVPEFAWNGTCGSELLASFNGFSQTFGSSGFCNSSLSPTSHNLAGGGGASACATGTPLTLGVIGGTCAGEPKPSWQENTLGNPNDGVRDIPDVAMFASSGVWNHAYAICFSDTTQSSNDVPCTQHFQLNGGTSASTPLMAGIQLLIDQATGSLWGNPDPVYYALARAQYGTSGDTSCNASLGRSVGSTCVFHDVTQGDNVVPCKPGTLDCFSPSGNVGVLSLSTTAYQPAFTAGVGWDFTTGLGSVNAANLLKQWAEGVSLSGVTPIQ